MEGIPRELARPLHLHEAPPLDTSSAVPDNHQSRDEILAAARQAAGFAARTDALTDSLTLHSNNTYPIEQAACIGTFKSAPPPEAFALNPPQIGLNGGLAVFRQNCDHDSIKMLIGKGFKPYV